MNLQLFAEGDIPPQQVQAPQQAQPDNQVLNILSGLRQEVNGMNQRLNTPAPKSAEQVQADRERLLEEFNSNPDAVLNRIQQAAETRAVQKAESSFKPVMDQMQTQMQAIQWSDATRRFIGSNPSAAAYSDAMSNILKTNPILAEVAKKSPDQALKLAHSQAVSEALAPNGDVMAGITGNEALKNQILSNPDIKQAIINEYIASLNGGAQGVPPIMGNGTATPGIAPTQANQPHTMQDARKSAEARIAAHQQNQMQ